MRLNVQTDYALRLVMDLAVNDEQLMTIADVAKRFGISKNHLMKVANTLGREGVIETVRGRSGGLRLGRPPSEIVVGDVVRCMEMDFAVVECFKGRNGNCLITPACRLKGALYDAVQAFLAVLDRYTVEDLVKRNPSLRALLNVKAA